MVKAAARALFFHHLTIRPRGEWQYLPYLVQILGDFKSSKKFKEIVSRAAIIIIGGRLLCIIDTYYVILIITYNVYNI